MLLYKMLLTLNATSWMAIIYAIKEGWTVGKIPSHLFGIILLIVPVFLSWLSLALSRFLGTESPVVNCKEFNLADGEFLPIYMAYFFVSVGVSEHFTMAVVYLIVFVFTFATVYKGNIIKNLIMDCQSYTKYRPNETTGGIFVSWRRKEELPTGA